MELPEGVDNHKQRIQDIKKDVDTDLYAAYQSLERVVDVLLTFDNGDTRLSSTNTQVLDALRASSLSFEQFCSRADDFAKQLGSWAGECMQLGDEADNFLTGVRNWQSSLVSETESVRESISSTEGARIKIASRMSILENAVHTAIESRDVSHDPPLLSEID